MSRVLLLLVALLVGVVPALLAQTPGRPEVVSLDFEGNASLPSQTLANAIETRETACRSVVLAPFCWAGSGFAFDRSYLNPRDFQDDYVRVHLLYRMHGFRSAQVDTVVTRNEANTAEILFRITEGERHRIGSLTILGLEGLDDPGVVTEALPAAVGDPLSTIEIEAARDSLTQRLRNQGYAHADVLRSIFYPAGQLEAEVEYDVYTGPLVRFGPIEIVGDDQVEEEVVRRMLPFQEGTVYSQEALFEGQRNIYSLEIFSSATIVQDLAHQPDSIVPLEVQVSEGNMRRVWTGAGWNSAECFDTETRWSSLNFFGGARRLVLRGRVSNLFTHALDESICSSAGTEEYGDVNWLLSSDLTLPFIFSPRNAIAASIYAERQSLQDVFVREAVGGSVSLARSLGRTTTLTLSYRPEYVRLVAAEVFFCTSFLVCDPEDVDILQAPNRLSPMELTFSIDRTNRVLSPTSGYAAFLDLEHASSLTASDFDYDRAVVDLTGFRTIFGDKVVLATRVRAGRLWAGEFEGISSLAPADRRIAHPQKRFYAGGANSVRGFPQNRLGPEVASIPVESLLFAPAAGGTPLCIPEEILALTCDASSLAEESFTRRPTGGSNLLEGSVEVRFPIRGDRLNGVAFVDFGSVTDGGAAPEVGVMRFTPGLGLRYSTPIGPIRVDVAYRRPVRTFLPVVTSNIRAFDPATDPASARLTGPGGETLDWVRIEDLAPLALPVPFDREDRGLTRRLQLHLSIGQAF